ncbi:MAG: GNAT family N-acetyltransferase [Bacteroidota bacterium]
MLTGTLVRLRAIEPKDIDLMYQWENDMEVWNVSGTTSPFSKYTIEKYMEECKRDIYSNKQLRLAIELADVTKKTIGFIDLYDFDPHNQKAGVGILIGDKGERRKKYGKEALQLLIKYAFGILNLHQLYCHVHESNHNSFHLFSSAGFKKTGVLEDWIKNDGEWEKVFVMQLLNEDEPEE